VADCARRYRQICSFKDEPARNIFVELGAPVNWHYLALHMANSIEVELARVLACITTGIYVLTVADGDRHHGMSSSWVTQVSGVPPLLMAAVDAGHFSGEIIANRGCFGLNVVGQHGKALEDYFYSAKSRRPDNLSGISYSLSPKLQVPWLSLAMASIEARVIGKSVAGDHTLWIAEPIGYRSLNADQPVTSHDLPYVYLGGKEIFTRDELKPPDPQP
jgi:flavin reductase (DIM6/NTAB) family NADH-FMN oxidoreductase RutF